MRSVKKATRCLACVVVTLWGCHGGSAHTALPDEPEILQQPAGQPSVPYGPWRRHTAGRVGEDLFGVPLGAGSGVVFCSNRHSHHYKLYLKGGEGAALKRLTSGRGHDLYPTVSPDGSRIAFVSTREGGPRLYLLAHLDDPAPERIGDSDVDAVHPSWSPDGRHIAYSRLSAVSGEWEIWIVDLETGQQQFVTDGLFPQFDPTGDRLVFQRARLRDRNWFSIWTTALDGTRQLEIVSGKDWGAVNPTYSPDGRWIAFNSVAKSSGSRNLLSQGDDLWCVRASGEGLTRLTFHETPEWNPAWGSDGRLYFTATRSHATSIWSLDPRPFTPALATPAHPQASDPTSLPRISPETATALRRFR